MRVLLTLILGFSSLSAFSQVFEEFEFQLKKAKCNDLLQDKIERLQTRTLPMANDYEAGYLTKDQVLSFIQENQRAYLLSWGSEVRRSGSRKYSNNQVRGGDCSIDNSALSDLEKRAICRRIRDNIAPMPRTSENNRNIDHPEVSLNMSKSSSGTFDPDSGVSTVEHTDHITMGVHFKMRGVSSARIGMGSGVFTNDGEINELLKKYYNEDQVFLSKEISAEVDSNDFQDSFKSFEVKTMLLGEEFDKNTVPSQLAYKVCNNMYNSERADQVAQADQAEQDPSLGGDSADDSAEAPTQAVINN